MREEGADRGLNECRSGPGSIQLENVSFAFEGVESTQVLRNINLSIQKNKTTAIVGVSGSGKTTLLNLILGIYQPTGGRILIDGIDLRNVKSDSWRNQVGVVMQDNFIFSDTIKHNICLSQPSPDQEKMEEAARIAGIKEFIDSLPSGYDTRIGDTGMGLSQGQKQRLLIARALYENPEFLFLDEATNALDAKNESAVVNNLETFLKHKTVIIVAHRLSTVKNADCIIVMRDGEIVESDTHASLVARKGNYYSLIRNQLELCA